ncbi:MAG: M67 family metallopeptidase [Pseudomonadota bacterium]
MITKTLIISAVQSAEIIAHAQREFPSEACGLLYGVHDGAKACVDRIAAAPNVETAAPQRRFSIDPGFLLQAHKAARRTGEAIIGHYHSHPSGEAQPSLYDVSQIADPRAIWLICGISSGHAAALQAFMPDTDLCGFIALDMTTITT